MEAWIPHLWLRLCCRNQDVGGTRGRVDSGEWMEEIIKDHEVVQRAVVSNDDGGGETNKSKSPAGDGDDDGGGETKKIPACDDDDDGGALPRKSTGWNKVRESFLTKERHSHRERPSRLSAKWNELIDDVSKIKISDHDGRDDAEIEQSVNDIDLAQHSRSVHMSSLGGSLFSEELQIEDLDNDASDAELYMSVNGSSMGAMGSFLMDDEEFQRLGEEYGRMSSVNEVDGATEGGDDDDDDYDDDANNYATIEQRPGMDADNYAGLTSRGLKSDLDRMSSVEEVGEAIEEEDDDGDGDDANGDAKDDTSIPQRPGLGGNNYAGLNSRVLKNTRGSVDSANEGGDDDNANDDTTIDHQRPGLGGNNYAELNSRVLENTRGSVDSANSDATPRTELGMGHGGGDNMFNSIRFRKSVPGDTRGQRPRNP